MIDTAIPDTIAEGLINFDKRRKEFEVLARIRLLQGAANAYNFSSDPLFDRWFHSIVVLDDREAYKLSCQIESPPPGNTLNRKKKQNGPGHRKNDSLASTSSSSSSQFYCDLDSLPSSPHNSLDRRTSPSQMSSSSSSSSLPSLDVSLGSGGGGNNSRLAPPVAIATNGTSTPNLGVSSPSHSHKSSPDFYIIKVTMESDSVETEGVVLYKSIMLSNNERTPQVVRNAMLKLGIEGNTCASVY